MAAGIEEGEAHQGKRGILVMARVGGDEGVESGIRVMSDRDAVLSAPTFIA